MNDDNLALQSSVENDQKPDGRARAGHSLPLHEAIWAHLLYGWKYFKLGLHSAIVWGAFDDVHSHNEWVRKMYPKEWNELQAIKARVRSANAEESQAVIDSGAER